MGKNIYINYYDVHVYLTALLLKHRCYCHRQQVAMRGVVVGYKKVNVIHHLNQVSCTPAGLAKTMVTLSGLIALRYRAREGYRHPHQQ